MNVEMVGGPRDGEVFDVPRLTDVLVLPVLRDELLADDDEEPTPYIDRVELPIRVRPDGRLFVEYRP